MKLSPAQIHEKNLTQFGAEAVALVKSRKFSELADRFGYALAYGRNVAKAIEDDFDQCLAEATTAPHHDTPSIVGKYFKPNNIPLYAVVECVTPISIHCTVLIELVVTGVGEEKHITLEQISNVA